MRQTAVFFGFFVAFGPASGCDKRAPTESDPAPAAETREHGLAPEQAQAPLVKIGDHVITVGTFAERLAEKSPYLRARYSSPERRREFLEELVKLELLAVEAERRGLLESPAVQRTREQVMVQQMMKEEFEDEVRLSDITDDEIEAYYEAHPEEFHKPEQVRASQIVLRTRKDAEKVLAKLRAAPDDDRLFRDLVGSESVDAETQARGGDLQFFSRTDERGDTDPALPSPLVEAAFTLKKIGDLYPEPVEVDGRYHVLRLTGRRRALDRSLDHARRPIQNRLWRQKRDAAIDAFVADLRSRAHVEEHWDRLDAVFPAKPPSEAAAKE